MSVVISVGTGLAIAGAGAAITAGAAIYGANKTSGAATHAADLTSKAAADTLTFQKQQAAQELAKAQATQKASYDQWAARQGNLSTLGQMMGLPQRNIPAYVPTINTGAPPAPPLPGRTPTPPAPAGPPPSRIAGAAPDARLEGAVDQPAGAV
jgi:hypothetical protein